MKKIFILIICLLFLTNSAKANLLEENKRTIIGTLAGVGLGLIVGNNVNGIDQGPAALVLGVVGGLIGHHNDRQERKSKRIVDRPKMPITNRHPGVDLIKISITHSNGISTDIRILRVNGKFIGPQEEEYKSLPTTSELLKRYGR